MWGPVERGREGGKERGRGRRTDRQRLRIDILFYKQVLVTAADKIGRT